MGLKTVHFGVNLPLVTTNAEDVNDVHVHHIFENITYNEIYVTLCHIPPKICHMFVKQHLRKVIATHGEISFEDMKRYPVTAKQK